MIIRQNLVFSANVSFIFAQIKITDTDAFARKKKIYNIYTVSHKKATIRT